MLLLGSSGPTVGQVAGGGAVAGAGRSSSHWPVVPGWAGHHTPGHGRGWRPEPEPEIHTLSPFISPLMVTRTPCKPGNEAWSFTNTEKVPTRTFLWLKAPTSAFTYMTLLKHFATWALTHGK